jgi:biopolymer transport protein ExbD
MAAKLGGIRGGKYTIGQNADINVTPFVDVMLVLLIIFMVSAPLATVAIKLDLPPAIPSKLPPPPDPTYINIQQGGVYIVAAPTTLQNLDRDLEARLRRDPKVTNPKNETILIKANQQVRYSDFMSVVNQLQTDGYFKISLITEQVVGAPAGT